MMLCLMCDKTRWDKIKNNNIWESVGVAPIIKKWWKFNLDDFDEKTYKFYSKKVYKMERSLIIKNRERFKKIIKKIV